MTSSVGFYGKSKSFASNSFEDDNIFENEDDENFSNHGYMYEVPYTSSSFDRSSIGSIPWADDAIKINKMEWEKVENMLSGFESLSDAEEDLSKEISDWQNKFPQIVKENQNKGTNSRQDILDIESLPSFDFTSYDEDFEGKTTPRNCNAIAHSLRKSSDEESNNLCHLMDNFTLKPAPFKLNQRETNRSLMHKRKCNSSTSSYSLHPPPSPKQQVPSVSNLTNRFRIPPILNVLDSKRKFRNLGLNKNPSFVQLTHVEQVKSAAVTEEQKSRFRFLAGHRSAWHVPFAANRFSNNRNSIILPSISHTPTTASTTSENIASPFGGTRRNLVRGLPPNFTAKCQIALEGSTTNASTQTNISNTSGRSISAAVKYPRINTFNALYLPYSASKFHAFH